MGNYIGRQATYSTNEIETWKKSEICEEGYHQVLKLDPRSPTAEIIRTPIQIDSGATIGTPTDSFLKPDLLDTPTSIFSTVATRSSEVDLPSICDLSAYKNQCVDDFEEVLDGIDAELAEIQETYSQQKEKLNQEIVRSRNIRKDSNSATCQKLRFTPEKDVISKPVPAKSRIPLGVRSTNTAANFNSPSGVLRMKQQLQIQRGAYQKFQGKQANNSFNCENTPPNVPMTKAATLPRKRKIIEWDQDSTMII